MLVNVLSFNVKTPRTSDNTAITVSSAFISLEAVRLELTSYVLLQHPLGLSRAACNSCFLLFLPHKQLEVLVMEPVLNYGKSKTVSVSRW